MNEPRGPGSPIVILILAPATEEDGILTREELAAEALAGLTRAREGRDAAEAQLAQAKRNAIHGSGDKAARMAAWESALAESRAACDAHAEAVRRYQRARSL